MFPLILAVLNRDESRGYFHPFLRMLSIGGNIPLSPDPEALKLTGSPTRKLFQALINAAAPS